MNKRYDATIPAYYLAVGDRIEIRGFACTVVGLPPRRSNMYDVRYDGETHVECEIIRPFAPVTLAR